MKLKKGIIGVVSAATLLACVSPSASLASTTKLPQVSHGQVDDMKEVMDVVNELDRSNLNMENLSENKQSDINRLSADAKELYYIFAQASEESEVDTVEALSVIRTAYESMNSTTQTTKQASVSGANYAIPSSIIGGVKTYKLSNQQVVDIGKLVGVHGSGWGLIVAIAKKFGKSPTLATALIIAVPALGWAVLNACNRYNKGVIIKDVRIGASHSFSCSARK